MTSITQKPISDSLASAFGSTPYPTLVNQIQSVGTVTEDEATVKARLNVLLWQNYPYARTAVVTAAVAAITGLLLGSSLH